MKITKTVNIAKVPRMAYKMSERPKENCEFYENYKNYENCENSQTSKKGSNTLEGPNDNWEFYENYENYDNCENSDLRGTQRELRKLQKNR